MAEADGTTQGLLDLSVLVDLDRIDTALLPDECAVAAVTVAELSAAVLAGEDEAERARRLDRSFWALIAWEPLPFDEAAARAHGRLNGEARSAPGAPRPRVTDLFVAATAVANDLVLVTRRPERYRGLEAAVTVQAI